MLPGYASADGDLTGASAVQLPAGSNLAIVAGSPDPASGRSDFTWSSSCATITGDIEVTGVAAPPARSPQGRNPKAPG